MQKEISLPAPNPAAASYPTARRKSFGLRAKMLSTLSDSLPTAASSLGPVIAALFWPSMATVSSPTSPNPARRKLRASHAIPLARFSCARPILEKFILSGLITKPTARSNPTPSTDNFSQSGAASSGGVLPRPREQEHRLIRHHMRLIRAWNFFCARELRKILAANGTARTDATRDRPRP